MGDIGCGSRDNPRKADGIVALPGSGHLGDSLTASGRPSKFLRTEDRMAPGSESPTNKRDAVTNLSSAVPDGGYAWEPYVSAWRVCDKLNFPPLVFDPESFDEFDAVVSSIRKYQALCDQLSAGV